MSKKSALMVYQNLKNITEEKEYWDKYIKFHELYWDGPNASQNVFYGNAYKRIMYMYLKNAYKIVFWG